MTYFVFWQQIRPAYAFERFGKGGVAIYDGFRRGQSTLAFNTKQIIEFAKKTYTAKEVKAWEKDFKSIKLSNGSTIKLVKDNGIKNANLIYVGQQIIIK